MLDPMAGSGVAGVEALALGRKVILNDLNPLAYHLMMTLLSSVELSSLDQTMEALAEKLVPLSKEFYGTTCPLCKTFAEIAGLILHRDRVETALVNCSCSPNRLLHKRPTHKDLDLFCSFESQRLPNDLPDGAIPLGSETRKLLRRGIKRFSQLYSKRTL